MDQRLARIEQAVLAGQQLNQSDEDLLAAILAEDGDKKAEAQTQATAQARENFESLDFNKMSMQETVAAIMKRVGTELETQIGGLRDGLEKRFQETSFESANNTLKQEIQDVRKTYGKEFEDAYDDVLALAEKRPSLSLEDAFHLVTAKKVRGSLSEADKEKKKAADRAAGIGLPDSLTSAELTESLKGKKSHRETAQAIADSIGF